MNKYAQLIHNYKQLLPQVLRFVAVGLFTNAVGYTLYIVITYLGVPPKSSMTVLYVIGATVSYFGNRKLTFNATDALWSSGLRYVLAHCIGYAIDYTMLTVLHEQYGYAHQYVQICAVGVVAVYLFIAMKFFVFRATA